MKIGGDKYVIIVVNNTITIMLIDQMILNDFDENVYTLLLLLSCTIYTILIFLNAKLPVNLKLKIGNSNEIRAPSTLFN